MMLYSVCTYQNATQRFCTRFVNPLLPRNCDVIISSANCILRFNNRPSWRSRWSMGFSAHCLPFLVQTRLEICIRSPLILIFFVAFTIQSCVNLRLKWPWQTRFPRSVCSSVSVVFFFFKSKLRTPSKKMRFLITFYFHLIPRIYSLK